jgi:hypothetical protein
MMMMRPRPTSRDRGNDYESDYPDIGDVDEDFVAIAYTLARDTAVALEQLCEANIELAATVDRGGAGR